MLSCQGPLPPSLVRQAGLVGCKPGLAGSHFPAYMEEPKHQEMGRACECSSWRTVPGYMSQYISLSAQQVDGFWTLADQSIPPETLLSHGSLGVQSFPHLNPEVRCPSREPYTPVGSGQRPTASSIWVPCLLEEGQGGTRFPSTSSRPMTHETQRQHFFLPVLLGSQAPSSTDALPVGD